MSEYIKRDSAIDVLMKERSYTSKSTFEEEPAWSAGFHQGIVFAISDIASIPEADVRPVMKAEWYGEGDSYADGELVYDMWSCPICGKRFEEWEEKPNWKFCPNCGADMRG